MTTTTPAVAKKPRNYTIDLYRFIFSIGFVIGHIMIVSSRSFLNTESAFTFPCDTLLVFIALAGYFLMQNFRRQKQAAIDAGLSPVSQAWRYLKTRIRGLGPWFLVANTLGFVALRIWKGTPITQWFDALLNHLAEFCGLMLTGFGMGSNFDGLYGEAAAEYIYLCQPVWFISGLFITSYLLYFLLAWNEKVTVGIIVPLTAALFWGSCYINGITPNWPYFLNIGEFSINMGLIDMFCSLGVGCGIWVAVDKIKGRELSRGAWVGATVIQAFLCLLIPWRTLVPTNLEGNPFTFGWNTAYLVSIFFCFFLCLNKDGATKLLNRKCFGYVGGLSMYVYMLHWPFIIGVNALFPQLIQTSLPAYIGVVVVCTFALSVWAYWFNDHKLQPWLKTEPWFKREDTSA